MARQLQGVWFGHTPCLGQIWSNRPLISVLKCFGCAMRGLQNRDQNRETASAKMLVCARTFDSGSHPIAYR